MDTVDNDLDNKGVKLENKIWLNKVEIFRIKFQIQVNSSNSF